MDWVYLDNNATTQPAEEVVEIVDRVHRELWANPSSVHRFGQMVRHRVELARAAVAGLIGCQPQELVFTSGGTESCNMALWGVLDPGGAGRRSAQSALGGRVGETDGASKVEQRPVLITSKIEHSAVRGPAEALAQRGVAVRYLSVHDGGWVREDDLGEVLAEVGEVASVVLVSLQWVNNETGAVQPIEAMARQVQQYREGLSSRGPRGRRMAGRVLFHVDATQAVGKLPIDVTQTHVDLMTLSGHKFHGPKGVGALYVRPGVRLRPWLLGGPQEGERRGGTENTPGIIGMGVAVELAGRFLSDGAGVDRVRRMRDRFERQVRSSLRDKGIDVVVNSDPGGDATHHLERRPASVDAVEGQRRRVWNTSNLGFPRLEAEAILVALSERGVCASAGAACSSGSLEASPVLLAMGVPEAVAHGSVRFSLSRMTTEVEIDRAVGHVVEVVGKLSRTLPVGG